MESTKDFVKVTAAGQAFINEFKRDSKIDSSEEDQPIKYRYPDKMPRVTSAVDKPQKQTFLERLRQQYSSDDDDLCYSNQEFMRAKR